MIYITGDCHSDYRRMSSANFPEQKAMSKEDYVIIAGDFGFWDESKEQKYWLKWLDSKPFTTLWIDGNHENYDLLKTYPLRQWKGGNVHFITPSIIHLTRGQIFTIDGCRIFTFGGASSHDISGGILEKDDPLFDMKRKELRRLRRPFRINHISWWKEELPNQQEYNEGIFNLEKYHYEVDYIVTHCCASSTLQKLGFNEYQTDSLTDYLDFIQKSTKYKKWFFGHYHDNQMVSSKEILIYEQMIRIW